MPIFFAFSKIEDINLSIAETAEKRKRDRWRKKEHTVSRKSRSINGEGRQRNIPHSNAIIE